MRRITLGSQSLFNATKIRSKIGQFFPASRRDFLLASTASMATVAGWPAVNPTVAQDSPSTQEKRFKKSVKFGMVQVESTVAYKFRLLKKLDIKEYDLEVGKSRGWGDGFKAELPEGSCGWPDIMARLREMDYSR